MALVGAKLNLNSTCKSNDHSWRELSLRSVVGQPAPEWLLLAEQIFLAHPPPPCGQHFSYQQQFSDQRSVRTFSVRERAAYGDSHLQHRLIAQALTAELESSDIAKLACSSSRTLAHLQSEGRVVGDYRETVDRDGNSYAAKQSWLRIIFGRVIAGGVAFGARRR